MAKIDVVSSSKYLDKDKTLLGCFDKLDNIDVHLVHNTGEKSLASIYNTYIDTSEADYLILMHDDVSVEDSMIVEKIEEAIGDDSQFAICGPAGTSECVIQDKCLWHIMYNDIKSLSGAVAHYIDNDPRKCFMTNFGPSPKRVIMLDGLFLALNLKKIRDKGVRFDESYPCKWNFYDLDFCLESNKAGLKMTTYPIWMVHKSHGLADINQKDWNKGNEYFKKKWSKI
jgi:GT2 family glycosyltransferase